VRARVIGSAGSTVLTGPAIRARLGLRDTWFTFVRISSSARHSLSAGAASWGLWRTDPALAGRFSPAPRSRRLAVQRRSDGRWRTVTSVRTTRSGRYRLGIDRAGLYRVRADRVAGPSVRVW
jgi:hypothetical protein